MLCVFISLLEKLFWRGWLELFNDIEFDSRVVVKLLFRCVVVLTQYRILKN